MQINQICVFLIENVKETLILCEPKSWKNFLTIDLLKEI